MPRIPGGLAMRRLLRTRSFSTTAIITLALGIAANVAVFSVVRTVLLEPLPYAEPENLVAILYSAPGIGMDEVPQAAALHLTYLDQSEAFETVAMWDSWRAAATGNGPPEEIPVHDVTIELLPLLGVDPVLGRGFATEDARPNAPRTAMLTHEYWQRRYSGDPSILGQGITLQGLDRTIIGVLPPGFRLLDRESAVLMPLQLARDELFVGMFNYAGVGRLKDGVTLEQASADLNRLLPIAVDNFPGGLTRQVLSEAQLAANLHPLHERLVGDVSQFLWILFAAVGVVMLIACANVANLFLVRSEARHQELAVRSALGASRPAILGELLSESLWLGLFAGFVGIPLGWALVRLLRFLAPEPLPRVEQVAITPSVVVFGLAVSVLAGLMFGLLPALRQAIALSRGLVRSLKEGGRGDTGGRSPARALLVIAQIALGLVLLVGGGLLLRSFDAMKSVDPGFSEPRSVMTFRVGIPGASLEQEIDALAIQRQILDNLRAIPGVSSVGATTALPMSGRQSADATNIEDFPVEEGSFPPVERFKFVTPGLFETLGQSLLAGRTLAWTDLLERRPVVVVDEAFARKYWGEPTAALGKRVAPAVVSSNALHWREIVGVVKTVHDNGPAQPAESTLYFPTVMNDFWGNELFVQRSLSFALRTERTSDPSLLTQIQQAVWSQRPDLAIAQVETMDEIYQRSMSQASFAMLMLLLAAGAALLIGSVGIYGVVAYIVAQRTREFGVRMALGATAAQITSAVLRYGMVMASIGVAVGLIAAALLSGTMARLLFGVEPRDPLTFGVVALVLAAITLLASALASRRAAQVDPVTALRAD